MEENQHLEWKAKWRDEYIKWICGFANAGGGRLEIGKNDEGIIVGINNAQKLLEDIPNKVRDLLGIIVDVDLHVESGKYWLSIEVMQQPFPVSYKGQYHYRSGSTKQELKGAALDRFLLRKQGKTWDSVPVPNVTVKDLSPSAFDYFKKNALRSNRLDKSGLQGSRSSLLDKLHLTAGAYLKRAALLLFHPDPERFFTGAFIKIGYFSSDAHLVFQDEVHGHLFGQVEKAMDLLLTKYLAAYIRYQGLNRIEEYSYPEDALREALLNAIAHKDYGSGNPIQIKVYEDKIIFWNAGRLPDALTVESLLKAHPSIPSNPDIAMAFFRAGLIEAWGRGTLMIVTTCQKAGLPQPVFTDDASGFRIEFVAAGEQSLEESAVKSTVKSAVKSAVKVTALLKANPTITLKDVAEELGVSLRTVEKQVAKLKKEGQLKRVGPSRGGYWKVIQE